MWGDQPLSGECGERRDCPALGAQSCCLTAWHINAAGMLKASRTAVLLEVPDLIAQSVCSRSPLKWGSMSTAFRCGGKMRKACEQQVLTK